jgi:hypothetical protein
MRPWLLLLLPSLVACGPEASGPPVHTREGLSPSLKIERKYGSMEGPSAESQFVLQPGPRELLWVTAYRTEIVNPKGESNSELAEFMCHNNLDFDAPAHAKLFGLERPLNFGRIFTASQGVFDIVFPEGLAIPVLSDEPFTVNTMALNHNVENADFAVRHRIVVEYVRDLDAPGAFEPLYPVAAMVMALVQGRDGYYGLEEPPDHAQSGASCAPGQVAPNAPEGTQHYTDTKGRIFTPHWVVPPGREVRRTLVTDVLNVPFETNLHYIGAHLHPYAESLALRDLTTNETLYTALARAPAEGIGLDSVDHYASRDGIPLHPDHEYELVSVYENPTDTEKDAMAVFFLYFHDREAATKLDAVRAGLAAAASPGA